MQKCKASGAVVSQDYGQVGAHIRDVDGDKTARPGLSAPNIRDCRCSAKAAAEEC